MLQVGAGGDFRLGGWLAQPAQCRLSKDGRTVQVRAKVMDLLAYLASRQGHVVSKDDLLNDVWASLSVSESALTRTVAELRHALGDDADHPQLLETIAKRGYRLIAEVEYVEAAARESQPASIAPHDDDTATRPPAMTVPAFAPAVGDDVGRRSPRVALSLALVTIVTRSCRLVERQ
jgi:DNA-binding winged helix-turn-helix (wHTH) protein